MTDNERALSMLQELEHDYISYDNLHGDSDQGCRVIQKALKNHIMTARPAFLMKPVYQLTYAKTEKVFEIEFKCPSCNYNEYSLLEDKANFCRMCGTGIDWSEMEEELKGYGTDQC